MKTTISICIPSYNRPEELLRLLKSIDSENYALVDILVCEDKSPKRDEIARIVADYKATSPYNLTYIENVQNLGYDKNIKNLVANAQGDFIVFMGDDDTFIPGALDLLHDFLSENEDLGYVLKSHRFHFKNGKTEEFRYFDGNQFFDKGLETYVTLFRRSVFISGFTVNRHYAKDLITDKFDGGLLYQMYLLAETAMHHRCAYFDTPLTQADDEGIPYFGSSETEKGLYTPGTITVNNSLQFLSGFFDITTFMDKKYNIESTSRIKHDMSKYFYPSLAIQRNKGVVEFLRYVKKLSAMGFNSSLYYYIYVAALTVLGKSVCDNTILTLKKMIGRTPQL